MKARERKEVEGGRVKGGGKSSESSSSSSSSAFPAISLECTILV